MALAVTYSAGTDTVLFSHIVTEICGDVQSIYLWCGLIKLSTYESVYNTNFQTNQTKSNDI